MPNTALLSLDKGVAPDAAAPPDWYRWRVWPSSVRQATWLAYFNQSTPAEQRVLRKIILLARRPQSRPVHSVMAMAKALRYPGVGHVAFAVMACRMALAKAKAWHNMVLQAQAHEFLRDLFIACDVWSGLRTREQAQRYRQFRVVQTLTPIYAGKTIPFRFASPLRNCIGQFKQQMKQR